MKKIKAWAVIRNKTGEIESNFFSQYAIFLNQKSARGFKYATSKFKSIIPVTVTITGKKG